MSDSVRPHRRQPTRPPCPWDSPGAAFIKERRNLAYCRTGEYESLASRLGTEQWKPDFGPNEWNEHVAHTGATQVGARDFLVAINYNLNTTSTRRANAIAFDVREKGRPMREGGKVTGKPMKDENGKPIMIPGTLKATKAIGWFIEDYGIAPHHFMGNRWGNSANSVRLYFLGLQNHCRW